MQKSTMLKKAILKSQKSKKRLRKMLKNLKIMLKSTMLKKTILKSPKIRVLSHNPVFLF